MTTLNRKKAPDRNVQIPDESDHRSGVKPTAIPI